MSELADTYDEEVRLAAYRQLDPVAATGDPMLQRIARLAARVTGARYSGLHFIDDEFLHRIASVGAPLTPWPRSDSICTLVMGTGVPLEVADAAADSRLAFASLTHGETPIRYYASYPLITERDQVIGTVCVWDTVVRSVSNQTLENLGDLAALVVGRLESLRANRILAEAAMTDPLTGLGNRRMFNDAVERALASAQRRGGEVGVLYLDLDGFKEVNDEYGHEVGDLVIRTVGQRLRDEWRTNEMIARLGGDEFVILLDGVSGEDAMKAAHRVEEVIGEVIEAPEGRLSVGASVGFAFADGGETADALVRRADLDMYAAKAARRRKRGIE